MHFWTQIRQFHAQTLIFSSSTEFFNFKNLKKYNTKFWAFKINYLWFWILDRHHRSRFGRRRLLWSRRWIRLF